jgi:hypothetical protein
VSQNRAALQSCKEGDVECKEGGVDLNLALSDADGDELICTMVKQYPEDDNEIFFSQG